MDSSRKTSLSLTAGNVKRPGIEHDPEKVRLIHLKATWVVLHRVRLLAIIMSATMLRNYLPVCFRIARSPVDLVHGSNPKSQPPSTCSHSSTRQNMGPFHDRSPRFMRLQSGDSRTLVRGPATLVARCRIKELNFELESDPDFGFGARIQDFFELFSRLPSREVQLFSKTDTKRRNASFPDEKEFQHP